MLHFYFSLAINNISQLFYVYLIQMLLTHFVRLVKKELEILYFSLNYHP